MITTLKIKAIKKLNKKATVYDIGVDGTNNFFVGESQILTGNCDGLTSQAQAALRNTMESYAKFVRFILTANYKHKIIPALQSRCQFIDIKPSLEDSVKRCVSILKNENVSVTDEQKKKFVDLIRANYPDLRKCINELQKNCISSKLCIESISTENVILSTIHSYIFTKKDVIGLRKFLIENESAFYGDYDNLMRDYLNYLYQQPIDDYVKKQLICVIAEHLYRSAFVLDHEINCFACWISMESIISQQ